MIFDIHGDIWTDVTDKRLLGMENIIRTQHLKKFESGNMSGGIFVIWSDPKYNHRANKRFLESLNAMIMEINQNRDILKIIYNSKDYYTSIEEGKIGILLGLEGLHPIDDDLNSLYTLYQLGFRHCSLTWNEENKWATGVGGDSERGLTIEGAKAAKIIEDLGIILDVSHANDKTFWDIYNISTKPFIASHSNCRSICDVERNLTDDQIKAIGEIGGLIGINSYNGFVSLDPKKRTIETLVDHLDHIVSLIGINSVGLGFDFLDYLDDYSDENSIIGLEDISKSSNLIDILKMRGYSNEDIEKISYKNFINIMDKIL